MSVFYFLSLTMGKRLLFILLGIFCLITLTGCTQNEVSGRTVEECPVLTRQGWSQVFRCEYENGDYCYVLQASHGGGISCSFHEALNN